MQPLKRKRDESPTTPQKLMKIQLTIGRRLTCVVPGPLVIPATPSPPLPPSPEDQVLNLFARTSSVWNAYAVRSLCRFRLLVKWEDDGEWANLCGPGQSVVIWICATSLSGKRQLHMLTSTIFLFVQSDAHTDDNNPPKMFAIFMFVQCQKLQKSSSADSVQENMS
ncbi:hypothetical protein EDB89DRAFT_1906294 [Lactarius sanguifluus]|nr:hypothetical protein EDB89DRAFT_1906294 [Lactarius sanguifluus]